METAHRFESATCQPGWLPASTESISDREAFVADLLARLVEESDLAGRSWRYGVLAPNRFVVGLDPRLFRELPDHRTVGRLLERAVESESMERGHRLDGPVRVSFARMEHLNHRKPEVRATYRRGRRHPWAQVVVADRAFDVSCNQAIIGHAGDADVVLDFPSISLHHALIGQENRQVRVRDLGSETGTFVDGAQIEGTTWLEPGSTLRLGDVACRLTVAS